MLDSLDSLEAATRVEKTDMHMEMEMEEQEQEEADQSHAMCNKFIWLIQFLWKKDKCYLGGDACRSCKF